MKEFLKSLGYTVAGITTMVAIVVLICWCLDALASVNRNLQYGVVSVFMLLMITAIVHLIRTGK